MFHGDTSPNIRLAAALVVREVKREWCRTETSLTGKSSGGEQIREAVKITQRGTQTLMTHGM